MKEKRRGEGECLWNSKGGREKGRIGGPVGMSKKEKKRNERKGEKTGRFRSNMSGVNRKRERQLQSA